ncbi:hypothetical protein LIER_33155 [Lithospermum erythrorhizon]|uniref:Growth-regulating factor n=1 Tax=Lithospermum erythrorhizon TaxID=34254 RepID=A0AAV3RZY2_LITER
MEKGNRSTSSSRLGEIPPYDCDVNLGLNMQEQQGGYPSKRAMISPHFLPFQQHSHPYPHPHPHHLGGSAYSDGGGSGGELGGSHLFNSTNNQLFTTHDAALTHAAGGVAMRAPFTTQQRHELERQNMIFKYLTSYNSPPAHLLSPFSRNPTSQTNSMDMKFSSGSDPEPWRCRRTDGKKWRCTRDVAPDQKYCERHAHKSRPRSRKHVEIQPHNNNNNNNSTTKFTQQIDPPNPFSSSSTKGSATSYDQTRQVGIEWLIKGGSGPSTISKVSTCNVEQKQKQKHNQPSARMGFSEGSSDFYKKPTVFEQQENDQGNQESIQLNPYMGNDYYPYFDPKVMNSLSQRSPTRHFTDGWPLDEIKGPFSIASGSRELPLSSLKLSMSGGDTLVADNDPESKKSQWMASNVSWLNSTGGPLGEALCLGNSTGGTSDLPSPYGCTNNSNTTSSCSKGSCEEGNHQFNFIG